MLYQLSYDPKILQHVCNDSSTNTNTKKDALAKVKFDALPGVKNKKKQN